jgi:predicted ribosome quality control (RQC) complex YloA/Tae2 family protein
MTMVRVFLVHAALLSQTSAAARRFHVLPHHVLGFARPPSVVCSTGIRARRFDRLGNNRDCRKNLRGFGSKLMDSSTDHVMQEHTAEEVYIDGDGLMYDSDADEHEEMGEPLVVENEQSRSHLLHKALFESVQSALKNINKKTTSLQRELEKAQSLEDTMWRANLIVSNLYQLPPGTTSIEVQDWENDGKVVELVLNTKEYSSAQDESDALFALARKMKRGSNVVAELLKESLDAEECLKDGLCLLTKSANAQNEAVSFEEISESMQIDEGELVLIQEKLERTSKKTGFKSPNLDTILNTNTSSNVARKRNDMQNQKSQRETRYKPNPRELLSPSGHKGKKAQLVTFIQLNTTLY